MKRLFFVIAACASIVTGCLCLWKEMGPFAIAMRCAAVFAGIYASAVILALVVAVSYFTGGKEKNQRGPA
jgi:hypothetical protein